MHTKQSGAFFGFSCAAKQKKRLAGFSMSCLGLDDSKFFCFHLLLFLASPHSVPMLLYFIKPLYFVITESL